MFLKGARTEIGAEIGRLLLNIITITIKRVVKTR